MQLVSRRNADLRLTFRFERDRFVHAIERRTADRWEPLWTSREGDDSQDWPASPALQEIAPHESPDGAVLLGVGKAGRSHWSIVFETPVEGADFRFDVACRIGAAVGPLGSSYDATGSGTVGNWSVEAIGDRTHGSSEASSRSDASGWTCDASSLAAPGRTVRWVYRWSESA